jgi:hypothetical protein
MLNGVQQITTLTPERQLIIRLLGPQLIIRLLGPPTCRYYLISET